MRNEEILLNPIKEENGGRQRTISGWGDLAL